MLLQCLELKVLDHGPGYREMRRDFHTQKPPIIIIIYLFFIALNHPVHTLFGHETYRLASFTFEPIEFPDFP